MSDYWRQWLSILPDTTRRDRSCKDATGSECTGGIFRCDKLEIDCRTTKHDSSLYRLCRVKCSSSGGIECIAKKTSVSDFHCWSKHKLALKSIRTKALGSARSGRMSALIISPPSGVLKQVLNTSHIEGAQVRRSCCFSSDRALRAINSILSSTLLMQFVGRCWTGNWKYIQTPLSASSKHDKKANDLVVALINREWSASTRESVVDIYKRNGCRWAYLRVFLGTGEVQIKGASMVWVSCS